MRVRAAIALALFVFAACASGVSSDDDDATSDDDADDDATDDDATDDDATDDDSADDDLDDDDSAIPDEDLTDYAPAPTNAVGIFVAKEGDDANPGTREAPKKTVQAGADAALAEGKSVFIAKGTYTQSVTTSISLFGGYDFPDWHRDISANETTVEATSDRAVTVVSDDFEAIIVIEGMTIKNGENTNETPDSSVLGIKVESSYSTVFSRIHVISGLGGANGQGMSFSGDFNRVVIIRSVVESATSGISFGAGFDLALINSIVSNSRDADGTWVQAILMPGTDSSLMIGSYLYGGRGNGSDSEARGIYGATKEATSIGLYNTIIDGGSGEFSAGIDWTASALGMVGTDIWGRDTDHLYCIGVFDRTCLDSIDAVNHLYGTDTNISDDPQFVDAENGDFHLSPTSPCVDGGVVPSGIDDVIAEFDWAYLASHIDEDFDGNPRPYGNGWDIGPYEWRP